MTATKKLVRLLPLVAAVVATLVGSVAVFAGSQPPSLPSLILRPSQVGAGYRLQQRSDGHGVRGFVTLDLCGFSFPSEQLRSARLQVNYVHSGTAAEVSNEIVRYRKGGAVQALREVTYAARHCPHTAVPSTVQGVGPLTYRIKEISNSFLLPNHLAILVSASGAIGGKHTSVTTVAVYQVHGDVLSGVYAAQKRGVTTSDQIHIALHAAAASGRILRQRAT